MLHEDNLIKDTTCKTLDLGGYAYPNTPEGKATTDKQINGINYFKCTNMIYNSTSKEIIVSEKWMTKP